LTAPPKETSVDDDIKVSHLPMSKRRRARLDQRAGHQTKYRKTLSEKKAPTREDFGRAALNVALILFDAAVNMDDEASGLELANTLRRGIVEDLEHVGFAREQIIVRFDKMSERATEDRERWRIKREWMEEKRNQE
jgi:hypothetical protein